MSFAPFLEMSLNIQLHAISALLGVLLGPFAILRRRRDRLHKVLGYIWVTAMATVATTALFIPSFGLKVFGHFGPIHLFVVLTVVSLFMGMRAIFRGNINAHREWLSGLYWQGLLLAGLFNFLPGRMTNAILFGDRSELGYVVLGLGGAALVWFRVIKPMLRSRMQAAI
jgi:uncharacterized membrane protein